MTGYDGTLLPVWLTHFLPLCSRKTDVMGINRRYAVYYHTMGGDAERGIRGRDFACCGGPLCPVLPGASAQVQR